MVSMQTIQTLSEDPSVTFYFSLDSVSLVLSSMIIHAEFNCSLLFPTLISLFLESCNPTLTRPTLGQG